jgi:DNA-binding NarL/FixJ family response regulator
MPSVERVRTRADVYALARPSVLRSSPCDPVVAHQTSAPREGILVVEDDEGLRELVRVTLETYGFNAVPAQSGEIALEEARTVALGGAIVDVQLPGISGYEVCRTLRNQFGAQLPIIMISGVKVDALDRVAGLLIAADDYMVKPFAPDELITRLRAAQQRAVRAVSRRDRRTGAGGSGSLSTRELEVLQLLAQGLSQAEIADRLVLSPRTVGNHIDHVLRKLGVRNRGEAIAHAYRENLTGTPPHHDS